MQTLVLWVRKAEECFKAFVDHHGRSMEDRGAESDVNCGGQAQKVSEEKNISQWPRHRSWDILVKNAAAFRPCPKTPPRSKLKSYGLTALAEERCRQSRIDCVAWLLVARLRQSYNEKEQPGVRNNTNCTVGGEKEPQDI